MFVGGFMGFTIFFSIAWAYLTLLDKAKNDWNPYAGAPALMTCLFIGSIGSAVGSIAGIFKKR